MRSASMTLLRASTFWLGATASSRSRNTTSALVPRAFSIIFSLLPGVDSSHRRKRIFAAPSFQYEDAAGVASLVSYPTLGQPQNRLRSVDCRSVHLVSGYSKEVERWSYVSFLAILICIIIKDVNPVNKRRL